MSLLGQTDNAVLGKAFAFAARIVKLCQHLTQENREYVLSKQLLRAGTSIGANINKAQAGQSQPDFIAKMANASKEARETKYWPSLLCETGYLDTSGAHVQTLLDESEQLIKLLTSIVKTSQSRTPPKA